jgi:hypothetical protein
MALLLAFAHAGDLPGRAVEVRLDELGFDARLQIDLLALAFDQPRAEGGVECLAASQDGVQRPVLHRHERLDLFLAIDDHAHGHRLDAASRQAAPHLPPQEVADGVADQAIQDATRLLGVDTIHVDLAWVLERRQHGAACDLVELDATHRLVAVQPERIDQVPGDGFPFAIGVGGEQDGGFAARLVLQAFDDILALLGHDVLRAEVMLDVHPQFARRQIADVPQTGTHRVVTSEKLLDGPGLCGRLDHHETF